MTTGATESFSQMILITLFSIYCVIFWSIPAMQDSLKVKGQNMNHLGA